MTHDGKIYFGWPKTLKFGGGFANGVIAAHSENHSVLKQVKLAGLAVREKAPVDPQAGPRPAAFRLTFGNNR